MNFSQEESKILFRLIHELTGQKGDRLNHRNYFLQNVGRRVSACGLSNFTSYLQFLLSSKEEMAEFMSTITIHTTWFFREADQFYAYVEMLASAKKLGPSAELKIISIPCSTGEEVYTLAILLEELRLQGKLRDYHILGIDIDGTSVRKAQKALYKNNSLVKVPAKYRRFFLIGSGKTAGLITLDRALRNRCHFIAQDIRDVTSLKERGPWDAIFCRNVLIYFDDAQIRTIISGLADLLKNEGHLLFGQSEALSFTHPTLKFLSNATYIKDLGEKSTRKRNRILIVDDSKVVRTVLTSVISHCGYDCTAVESADAASATMAQQPFDLITLDLNMPGTSGGDWLKQQRQQNMKLPVIIVSDSSPAEASQVLGALENYAQDYIEKQALQSDPQLIGDKIAALLSQKNISLDSEDETKLRNIGLSRHTNERRIYMPEAIVIGASTGGTEALIALLKNMYKQTPPLLIVQHISAIFARSFANRLSEVSGLPLGKMTNHEPLMPGHLYIALEDYHIGIKRESTKRIVLETSHRDPVNRHRPSVDFLFDTAAKWHVRALAIILTGMGKDGALGMLQLHKTGLTTMAQNQQSCVVYGMPKAAVELNAVSYVGNIQDLRREMDRHIWESAAQRKIC